MNFITKAASNYRGSQPFLGKVLIGVSGLSAFLSAWNYFESKSAGQELEYRKKQLSKPIYKLTPEQMIHPPWNKSNLNQWLYRRVEVTGKPIHRLSCMIPTERNGAPGFESVVPLVASENAQGGDRQGLLLALGFYPFAYRHIGDRMRIENVHPQTFVGFVSTMDDLGQKGLFDGNAYQDGRLRYSHADLEDMARSSQLKNRKQAEVAVVERLFQTGDINERRGKRYSNDCDFALTYPYYKTEAGALQSGPTPWKYTNKAKAYLVGSIASFIVGASVF